MTSKAIKALGAAPWAELPNLLRGTLEPYYEEPATCPGISGIRPAHKVKKIDLWGFQPENGCWVPVKRKTCRACREARFAKLRATAKERRVEPAPPVERTEKFADTLAELLHLKGAAEFYRGQATALKGVRSQKAWRSHYWAKSKADELERKVREEKR